MIHSKWSGGDLIFYDAANVIMTIKDDADGIEFGVDSTGVDVKFFGDTASAYMEWDADTDDLVFEGGAGIVLDDGDFTLGDGDYLVFGDSLDVTMRWTTGGVFEVLPLTAKYDMNIGSSTKPLDVKFFGTTGGSQFMQWQSSGNILTFDQADIGMGDTDYIVFGDGSDFTLACTTGDALELLPATANAEMYLGSTAGNGFPLKVKFFGTTGTAANMQWNSSGAELFLTSANIELDGGSITLGNADYVKFGDNDELTMNWTAASVFEVLPSAANADMHLGSTSSPLDVKFFGTSGTTNNMQWQSSGDSLDFTAASIELDGGNITLKDNDYLKFGDANDITARWSTASTAFEILPVAADSEVYLGSTGLPLKVKFFGTSGTLAYMQWSSTSSKLTFDLADIAMGDTDYIMFGDNSDWTLACTTGDILELLPASRNNDFYLGSTGYPAKVKFFGTSGTAAYMQWTSSGSTLDFDSADITMGDTDYIILGDDSDFTITCTAADVLEILPAVADDNMHLGSTGYPLDVINYGNVTYRDPASALGTTGVTITLTSTSNRIQFLNCTTSGTTTLVLPATTGATAGFEFKIFNNTASSGTLAIVDGTSGGTAICSLTQDRSALIMNDGVSYEAMRGSSA